MLKTQLIRNHWSGAQVTGRFNVWGWKSQTADAAKTQVQPKFNRIQSSAETGQKVRADMRGSSGLTKHRRHQQGQCRPGARQNHGRWGRERERENAPVWGGEQTPAGEWRQTGRPEERGHLHGEALWASHGGEWHCPVSYHTSQTALLCPEGKSKGEGSWKPIYIHALKIKLRSDARPYDIKIPPKSCRTYHYTWRDTVLKYHKHGNDTPNPASQTH